MIYLASTSPRRKSLLKEAGICFRILKPDYDENPNLKGTPSCVVQIHAVKKVESCQKKIKSGTILAADTIVYHQGKIIGKPKDMKDAHFILGKLQGRWHLVYTGVAMFWIVSGRLTKKIVFSEKTKVRLKPLTSKGITNYFKKVNPLDKAGAYAIQSSHGGIVEEVKGLFSNAVGLPIELIFKKL